MIKLKLTDKQKEKLNDFKQVYMNFFNKDNDEYMKLVINTIFYNVEKNYEEFSDEISYVPVEMENDKFNILKSQNGYYSLLDFLLNRVFKGIQKISITTENAYEDNHRNVLLFPKRYDKYYSLYRNGVRIFSDDFLFHQKIKSIMHESGHALQHRSGSYLFLENMRNIAKQLKISLGSKYELNDSFENTSLKYTSPFNSNSQLGEGLNEMYASLYSEVLEYDLSDKNFLNELLNRNLRRDNDNRVKTSLKRNCFNGYNQSKYFYILRALVSKRSIFNSLYFGKNDMLDEFYSNFKEIIDKYENETDSSVKGGMPKYQGDFFSKLMNIIGYCYTYAEDVNVYGGIYKYEKILDNIFIEALQKKISKMNKKDEELEKILSNIVSDSYTYIENNEYVNSNEKTKYMQLWHELKKKNAILPSKFVDFKLYGIYSAIYNNKPFNLIVLLKNDSFSVNKIELSENDVIIKKEKDSMCSDMERRLNEYRQKIISNYDMFDDIFNYIMREKFSDIMISKIVDIDTSKKSFRLS